MGEDLVRSGDLELLLSLDSFDDCWVVLVIFCSPSFSGVGVSLLVGDLLDSGDCVPGGGGGDSCLATDTGGVAEPSFVG